LTKKLPAIFSAVSVCGLLLVAWGTQAIVNPYSPTITAITDSSDSDADTASKMPFPFKDESFDPTDKDGVGNCVDVCPLISGSKYNAGCPILERKCGANDTCPTGLSCVKQDL
jgi:hypothetical protein